MKLRIGLEGPLTHHLHMCRSNSRWEGKQEFKAILIAASVSFSLKGVEGRRLIIIYFEGMEKSGKREVLNLSKE